MSPCPQCGKKAVHAGVVVPWETLETPSVLHACATCGLFVEPARDVSAMRGKVEHWIQHFMPQHQEAQSLVDELVETHGLYNKGYSCDEAPLRDALGKDMVKRLVAVSSKRVKE